MPARLIVLLVGVEAQQVVIMVVVDGFANTVIEIGAIKAWLAAGRRRNSLEGGQHVLVCLPILLKAKCAWCICSRRVHGLESSIHGAACIDGIHSHISIVQQLPRICSLVQ